MTLSFDAPPEAHARRSDPDTSSAAARSIGNMSTRRADVLRVLAEVGPCTDVVLVEEYESRMGRGVIGQAASGIRSRRAELVPRYVVDSTERAKLPSGRNATVWKLTDEGRRVVSG
jgi:hypothetical protein